MVLRPAHDREVTGQQFKHIISESATKAPLCLSFTMEFEVNAATTPQARQKCMLVRKIGTFISLFHDIADGKYSSTNRVIRRVWRRHRMSAFLSSLDFI